MNNLTRTATHPVVYLPGLAIAGWLISLGPPCCLDPWCEPKLYDGATSYQTSDGTQGAVLGAPLVWQRKPGELREHDSPADGRLILSPGVGASNLTGVTRSGAIYGSGSYATPLPSKNLILSPSTKHNSDIHLYDEASNRGCTIEGVYHMDDKSVGQAWARALPPGVVLHRDCCKLVAMPCEEE